MRMRHFYERTGLLLFPSLYEGYGMVAVEALCSGTPVVASDYPAIREGVGDGACIVPFTASHEHWRRASEQVLNERAAWVTKARARAAILQERQERELDALLHFLADVSTNAVTPTGKTEARA
jgi:glycosyltransferase involved in cell wall biosynthesis